MTPREEEVGGSVGGSVGGLVGGRTSVPLKMTRTSDMFLDCSTTQMERE